MAEGDEPPKFRNREHQSSDDSDTEHPAKLDLINLNPDKHTSTSENNVTGEMSGRREENPFSFKHFLQNDSKSYQNQGARPKVYCEGRQVTTMPPDLEMHSENKQRIAPEFSSALPDFVQDHLVIEQCYLGNSSSSNYNLEVNNLPDFTPGRSNNGGVRNNSARSLGRCRRDINSTSSINIPLDLPVRPQAEFPLDLPTDESGSRSCPPTSEVGNSKSLPDFLADGAVRTQNNENLISGQSPERETDRLRQELDLVRRQLTEQIRRADYLSRDLEIARNKEHEYTQNLAKALEQVEENLERSNMRAASSENTIFKLRQEVKSLTTEVHCLRRENRMLRGEEGASGGPGFTVPTEIQSQRLALELRQAANTAEHSLRQLLTGVDNLRMLASTVESMSRIEERMDPYNSDAEEETGPAL